MVNVHLPDAGVHGSTDSLPIETPFDWPSNRNIVLLTFISIPCFRSSRGDIHAAIRPTQTHTHRATNSAVAVPARR